MKAGLDTPSGKTIVDGDILIDRELGEALEPKVGYTHKC